LLVVAARGLAWLLAASASASASASPTGEGEGRGGKKARGGSTLLWFFVAHSSSKDGKQK
jgi:hypothetical protein